MARSASAPWPISRRPVPVMRPTSPTENGGKVVVQHEALLLLALVRLKTLRIVAGAESRGDQRLGLAAREERRTVSTGQHANFNRDGANFIEGAAIRADPILSNLLAEDALPKRFIVMRKFLLRRRSLIAFRKLFGQLILDLLDE